MINFLQAVSLVIFTALAMPLRFKNLLDRHQPKISG